MLSTRCLFALVLLLVYVCVARAQTFACGGAGYSLAGIGDLSVTTGGYSWTLNPCVPLTTGPCATSNATFCQGSTVVSYYNPTVNVVTWTTIKNGIMSHSINGAQDGCSLGTYVRTGAVEYICNATATTAFISGVQEVEQCQYLAQVQTSLVCGAPIAVTAEPVGLPFSSTLCGGGLFNLAALDAQDFNFTMGTSTYWWRPCTPVNTPSIANVSCPAGSSFCQSYGSLGASQGGYSLSAGNGLAQMYTLQSNGLVIQSQDGTICGGSGSSFGWPREANVILQCNAAATTPVFVSFTEGSSTGLEPTGDEICHYTFTIQTAAVCAANRLTAANLPTAPVYSPVFSCGGAGYDLSLISAVDMTYNAGGNTVYFVNPCRPLTTSPCAGQGATMCQAQLGGSSYVAAYWQPAYAPVMWSPTTYNGSSAIQSYSLYGDTGCGTYGVRTATVIYVCKATQVSPLATIGSVSEAPQCSYTAIVYTSLVCSGASNSVAAPAAVGYPFVSSTCGGGLFNLSSLDSRDLQFNTSSTQAYWWRPCSTATSFICSASSASFCQYDTPTHVWALASSIGSSSIANNTYTLQPNGLLIQSQDGSLCGSMPRAASTLLVCNTSATTPYVLSYGENQGTSGYLNNGIPYCHYELVLATSAVCTTAAAPSNATSSSSGGSAVVAGGGSSSAGSSSSASVAVRSSSSSSAGAAGASVSSSSSSSAAAGGASVSSSSSSAGAAAAGVSSSSSAAVVAAASSSSSSAAAAVVRSSSSSSTAAGAYVASSSSSSAVSSRISSSSSSSSSTGISTTSSSSSSSTSIGSSSSLVEPVAPLSSSSSSSSSVPPPNQNVNSAHSTQAASLAALVAAMAAACIAIVL